MKRSIDWLFLGLGLIAIAALLFVLSSCAIPVRPVARIEPDRDGVPHFVPDGAQEPHAPAGLMAAIAGVLSGLGPAGKLGGLALTALAAGGAGHLHGRRRAKKQGDKKTDEPKPGSQP